MSQQHAEAYITTLYNYDQENYETSASAYARRYLRHLLGEDVGNPSNWHGPHPKERKQIRDRVKKELER